MSKQNAKVYPDDLVIRRVHYWSAGALRQGERLMALIASQSKYGNTPSQWTPDQAREQHEANSLAWDHLVEELEGDFLVHAVRQLLLWLEQARAHGALSSADIDAFENDSSRQRSPRHARSRRRVPRGRGQAPGGLRASFWLARRVGARHRGRRPGRRLLDRRQAERAQDPCLAPIAARRK